ncbi:hypothetical protein P3T76_014224 [Phytophthora citrophthora]|uniref:Necrosis inducing-like protein NPP1 type n=1 Tax=Phytophthora citrophthora TaxID=4793 RepID=A0AAD9LCG3_9STRA|nr:hypothetical protein P3T76_014224 [Phytophthora citrophthora]
MKFIAVFIAAIASLSAVQAQTRVIPFDTVKPIPKQEPKTDAQKAAVKYQPQLQIENGCYPYPAVQADGTIGAGLQWSGPQGDECKGSPLGSQVYARSTSVGDKWAIMYAWYFPKGRPPFSPFQPNKLGHRHGWEYAVVWLDRLNADNSTILGVSLSAAVGWAKEAPAQKRWMDGNSLKVSYYFNDDVGNTAVKYTEAKGKLQTLITWDQLPTAARNALSNTDWDETAFNVGRVKMPMKDGVFMEKIKGANPF